jgi:hypothetical protein
MKANRRTLGLFLLMFAGVFWFVFRSIDSDKKGLKRFVLSVRIALSITFCLLSPAYAKDSVFLPGVDGFTPPLSRPAPNNKGYFGSKTTNSSGAPKKDPNGNGTSHNPAMKKDSQSTPTSHHDLSATSKKRNKQCSLKDEQKRKSRQAEKELKDRRGEIIKAIIAQKSDCRYFLGDAQARDKFLHAPDFGVKVPKSFSLEHAISLSYKDRLNYLRDTKILPEKSVREFQEALRDHVLEPSTREIKGTFGANREARDGSPKTHGTHLYNPRTKNDVFFGPSNRLKSGWKTNQSQSRDIEINNNLT